jgi:hypothetical protein
MCVLYMVVLHVHLGDTRVPFVLYFYVYLSYYVLWLGRHRPGIG